MRALPHGKRGQAEGLSAGGSGGALGRRCVRDLPQPAQPGDRCDTAQRWQGMQNEHQPASFSRHLARRGGGMEVRAGGNSRGLAELQMSDHWWGMLIDIPKCIGCGNCVRACQTENDVPDGFFRTWVERYHVTD